MSRRQVIDKAKGILGKALITDARTVDDIRKQVVESKKMGSVASGWDNQQIRSSFDTLTAGSRQSLSRIQSVPAAAASPMPIRVKTLMRPTTPDQTTRGKGEQNQTVTTAEFGRPTADDVLIRGTMSTVLRTYRPIPAGLVGMIVDGTRAASRLQVELRLVSASVWRCRKAPFLGIVIGGASKFIGLTVRDVTLDQLPLDPLADVGPQLTPIRSGLTWA